MMAARSGPQPMTIPSVSLRSSVDIVTSGAASPTIGPPTIHGLGSKVPLSPSERTGHPPVSDHSDIYAKSDLKAALGEAHVQFRVWPKGLGVSPLFGDLDMIRIEAPLPIPSMNVAPNCVDSSKMGRMATLNLFSCPAEDIDERSLREFVSSAIESRVQAESLMIEFKGKRMGTNVVDAVAAMSNTSGGLIFVGIAEKAADPFVGISQAEADSIVQQIRSLVPEAMPESIPVALSGSDSKLVMILRVDANNVERPVVVSGRVLIRVPGHTVAAGRNEIVSLVQWGSSTANSEIMTLSMDPSNMRIWDETELVPLELRVLWTTMLPRHLGGRRWLGSKSLDVSLDALRKSPIPQLLNGPHLRDREVGPDEWFIVETGALRFRLKSHLGPSGKGRPLFEAVSLVALSGRRLEVLISIRALPDPPDSGDLKRRVFELREILLAALHTANAVSEACALSIDATHGLGVPSVSGWLGGSVGVRSLQLEREWLRTPQRQGHSEWTFPIAYPSQTDLFGLDSVVVGWMIPMLFELGASNFEDSINEMPAPHWAHTAGPQ